VRALRGGEADAAENRKGDRACVHKLAHDCLLISYEIPVAGVTRRANRAVTWQEMRRALTAVNITQI
jgi:hypothetical protein